MTKKSTFFRKKCTLAASAPPPANVKYWLRTCLQPTSLCNSSRHADCRQYHGTPHDLKPSWEHCFVRPTEHDLVLLWLFRPLEQRDTNSLTYFFSIYVQLIFNFPLHKRSQDFRQADALHCASMMMTFLVTVLNTQTHPPKLTTRTLPRPINNLRGCTWNLHSRGALAIYPHPTKIKPKIFRVLALRVPPAPSAYAYVSLFFSDVLFRTVLQSFPVSVTLKIPT